MNEYKRRTFLQWLWGSLAIAFQVGTAAATFGWRQWKTEPDTRTHEDFFIPSRIGRTDERPAYRMDRVEVKPHGYFTMTYNGYTSSPVSMKLPLAEQQRLVDEFIASSGKDSRPATATAAGAVLAFALLLAGAAPLHAQGLFAGPSYCQPGQPCYRGPTPTQRPTTTYDPAWAAVVRIDSRTAEPGPNGGVVHEMGSGTLFHEFDDGTGLVVTNWHVVKDRASETAVDVHFVQVNHVAHCKVLEAVEAWDYAVLWCRVPPGVRPVPLRESIVQLDETLTAAGYAHAKDDLLIDAGRLAKYLKTPESNNEPYTLEVSTASRREVGAYEGMSGGPILDAEGRLAGVTWGSDQGRDYSDRFVGTCSARLCPLLERWRQRVSGGRPGDGGGRTATPTRPGFVPPKPAADAPTGVVGGVVPVVPPQSTPIDLGPLHDRLAGIDANLKALLSRELPKPIDLSRIEADLKSLKQRPVELDHIASSIADQTDVVGRHEVVIQELNASVKAIVPKVIAALPKVGAVVAATNPATAWLAPVLASLGGFGGMAVAWQFIKGRIDARQPTSSATLSQANQFVDHVRQVIAAELSKFKLGGSLAMTAQGPGAPAAPRPEGLPSFIPVQVDDPGHAALVKAIEKLGSLDPNHAAYARKLYSFRDQFLNQAQS